MGDSFETYVGICQGDCLSAVLFIFYLACTLQDDQNEQTPSDLQAFLEVFYADILTFTTFSEKQREDLKEQIPKKLQNFNLHINKEKPEEGEAPDRRPPAPPPPPPKEDPGTKILWSPLDWLLPPKMPTPEPSYKKIKLLGTHLDTKTDIIARKAKVWQPMKKIEKLL